MPIRDAKALAKKCADYSAAKGYKPVTWDELPYRLQCISNECEELTEALEEWRGREAHSELSLVAQRELADVAAYALLCLLHLFPNVSTWALRLGLNERITIFAQPDRVVRPLRRYAAKAHRAWTYGKRNEAQVCLELVVVVAAELAQRLFGADLDDIVDEKLTSMAGREACHGKDPRS